VRSVTVLVEEWVARIYFAGRTVELDSLLRLHASHRLQVEPIHAILAVVELVPRGDHHLAVHALRAVVRARDVVVLAAQGAEAAPEEEALDAQLPGFEAERGVERGGDLGGEHDAAGGERVQGQEGVLVENGRHSAREVGWYEHLTDFV
jgi:hypothetical protein